MTELIPEEVGRIHDATERVLTGESVSSICTDWNTQGVATVTGRPWTVTTIMSILTSGRIAGLREHKGVVVAKGKWEPIITEEQHEALVLALAPKRTKARKGRTYPLTSLMRCGLCGGRMRSLLLSHSALHRQFVGEVASELAVVGIHGFVAHDAMEYSKPWQLQIEQALRTMQAFVALVHPEVNQSAWCQQEIGWALGRRVPHYVLRVGVDPAGFIGRDQWPSVVDQTPKQVASVISAWVTKLPDLGPAVFDGLLEALRSAQNYVDAGATAERIEALGTLSDGQIAEIDRVWWTNDQLYGGALPSRAMRRVYAAHDRTWPPPKPNPPSALQEEEPF